MAKKVKLRVLGFSFNQTQTGTYGLVLAEEGGLRRLMVVVGSPEAQSIAFELQQVVPPRPLTHDLLKSVFETFNIRLEEVFIDKFVDGVFHSKLIVRQNDLIVNLDSRTSDAVAIAIRLKSPIYTTEDIMAKMAIVIDDSSLDAKDDLDSSEKLEIQSNTYDFSLQDIKDLQKQLDAAIQAEDYELASMLRDEIAKRES